MRAKKNIYINTILANWKSPYISREKFCELTGGMISQKSLRNLDSIGEGIPGKIRVSAKRVVYPVENALAWLNARIEKWNDNGGRI